MHVLCCEALARQIAHDRGNHSSMPFNLCSTILMAFTLHVVNPGTEQINVPIAAAAAGSTAEDAMTTLGQSPK